MRTLLIGILLFLGGNTLLLGQDLSPYIKVAETDESIQTTSDQVIQALKKNEFEVLGTYHPADKSTLKVIAFTRSDLKNTAVKVADRGALGAIMKVGLVAMEGKVTVSYTNPDYLLRAYLREDYKKHNAVLSEFASDLQTAFASLGTEFTPFGGAIGAEKLQDYHYKIMMPYFTDPITLGEYDTFEEGLKVIQRNLKLEIEDTRLVYQLVYPEKKIAVFGIGLRSKEDGESHFLPKIGEEHAAALPYEVILQGNTATMLHGKYRIALHWPDLTMGTFMKIMSTPGDIEDTLEAICRPGDPGSL